MFIKKLIIVVTLLLTTFAPLVAAEYNTDEKLHVAADTIVQSLKVGNPVKIDNARITGQLNFSEAISGTRIKAISSPISITNSTFEAPVFGEVTFSGALRFSNNSFKANTNFNSCKFEKAVDFNGSTFDGQADFTEAEFAGKANFSGATFNEDAVFKSAKLNVGITFKRTFVRRRADFSFVDFGKSLSGESLFEYDKPHSSFLPKADSNILLNDFGEATIDGGITFLSASINVPTRITNCRLQSTLDLRDISISPLSKLNWSGTKFGQLILLSKTIAFVNLGLDNGDWEAHLAQRINLAKHNEYNEDFKKAELTSMQVIRENDFTSNEVRYLTRVFETELLEGLHRYSKIFFLDWTVGYGYKLNRLLFWLIPLIIFFSIRYYYRRKTSIDLINKEREDRYPTWASRISKEIVGESHVMLTFIPPRHREYAFNKYQQQNPDMELRYFNGSVRLANYSKINKFVINWDEVSTALQSNNIDQFKEAAMDLLKLTTERLGLNIQKNPKYLRGKYGIMVHAPAIRLNVPVSFPFIFFNALEFKDEDIKETIELLRLLDTREQYFAINVVFDKRNELMQIVRDSIYRSDFVVIDKEIFWEIFAKKSPIKILSGIILSQVDLLAVSPYVTGGPVSSKMFFGRIDEEKVLLQSIANNNFAIVANRKIGKTSLLMRINDFLSKDEHFRVLLIDLQPVNNYKKFFRRISRSDPELAELILEISNIEPIDIYDVIARIKERTKDKALVIIFDEVDDILEYDRKQKYELFKTLRELSQNNICRFIFIGSRTLVKNVKDPYSPFFNFCKSMRLGCLEEKYARELVTGPMKEMGITFKDENRIVYELISVSSCHPNILQYICEQLLHVINKKSNRVITFEDAYIVLRSREFYEYYTSVLWGQASAYEKLVVYTMMKNDVQSFNENMVRIEFEKLGVPSIHLKDALQTLELYSLTRSINDHYQFTFKYLSKITKQEEDLESVINELREEVESTEVFF